MRKTFSVPPWCYKFVVICTANVILCRSVGRQPYSQPAWWTCLQPSALWVSSPVCHIASATPSASARTFSWRSLNTEGIKYLRDVFFARCSFNESYLTPLPKTSSGFPNIFFISAEYCSPTVALCLPEHQFITTFNDNEGAALKCSSTVQTTHYTFRSFQIKTTN